jgi:hypothetical protein
MPILANCRHEKFAQLVSAGMSASEAYRQSGGTGENAGSISTRLSAKGSIRQRIAEIRTENERKSEMSRQELTDILVGFIRNPDLCVWPHRVKSAELLAKICGWSEKQEVRVTIDPLQSLIDSIRARVDEPLPKQIRRFPSILKRSKRRIVFPSWLW